MRNLIVAYDLDRGIGKDNHLPWRVQDLRDDMHHFRRLTLHHTVIMGRKTLESIGAALPKRRNIVLSRDDVRMPGVEVAHSLDEAYAITEGDEELYIIGGTQVYQEALQGADRIYATEVDVHIDADTFFPQIGTSWDEVSRQHFSADDRNKFNFDIVTYERKKS